MAGYRLAPRAAQARRNPWQRRRRAFSAPPGVFTGTASDTVTVTDTAVISALSTSATAADTVTITDTASAGGLGSSNTAQGGLVWLFGQSGGATTILRSAADTVTVTDTAAGSLSSVGSYSRTAADTVTITSDASGSVSIVAPGTYTMRDTSAPFSGVSLTYAVFSANTVNTSAPFERTTTLPA